jgi:hypothetical protein
MSLAVTDAGGDLFAANLKGALLAVASSAFVGVSFIVKKKGLRRAGAAGARAGPLPARPAVLFVPLALTLGLSGSFVRKADPLCPVRPIPCI